LTQEDLAEMRREHHVLMRFPEFGAVQTRYMHQISPLLFVVNEVLIEEGPLHMIDGYVTLSPKV